MSFPAFDSHGATLKRGRSCLSASCPIRRPLTATSSFSLWRMPNRDMSNDRKLILSPLSEKGNPPGGPLARGANRPRVRTRFMLRSDEIGRKIEPAHRLNERFLLGETSATTLRGCEKMGTGAEPTHANPVKTASGEVPVPVFSQPLREEAHAERQTLASAPIAALLRTSCPVIRIADTVREHLAGAGWSTVWRGSYCSRRS
jgi:hypothetical protein